MCYRFPQSIQGEENDQINVTSGMAVVEFLVDETLYFRFRASRNLLVVYSIMTFQFFTASTIEISDWLIKTY